MNVNPGSLCKPIKIIQKTKTRGADGYYTETETTVYSGYAKFSRTSGTEMIKASADFADVKARFLIRYTTASIDRKMIVRYDGHDYEIVYINDYDDKHEYIEIWGDRMTKEART